VSQQRAVAWGWLGLVLMVIGAASSIWSAAELTRGAAEILEHWWSTVAMVPLVAGVVMTSTSLARLKRTLA
jgi:hypothetical protein